MTTVAKNEYIQIDRLTLRPFDTNSYIITCRLTRDSVLVDAPAEADEILRRLKVTNPRYILITHNHMDHLGALPELKSKLGIPVAVHPLDAKNLPLPPDILLGDGRHLVCFAYQFGLAKVAVLPPISPVLEQLAKGKHWHVV